MMSFMLLPFSVSSPGAILWSKAIDYAVIWNCFLLSSSSTHSSDNSRGKGEGYMNKQNIGLVVGGDCLRILGVTVIGLA